MTVTSWFAGASRVLFVHAHPDDETIATGGTLAALAESGRQPALVTLTRGERGETAPGPHGVFAGPDELAAYRETELAAALRELGVEQHAFLGTPPARAAGLQRRNYRDSGMVWAADGLAEAAPDAGDAALSSANAVDPLTDLIALADAWNIEAVVSYDSIGGYRHPDHVLAHRFAAAAAHGLELPFWEIVRDAKSPVGDSAFEVETHDVSAWVDRKRAALTRHATQLTVSGDDIVHVGGQRHPIGTLEHFRRRG